MSHFGRGNRNEAFFNQHQVKGSDVVATNAGALNSALRACHTSGSLSLTNKNLSDVPLQIFSASLDEGEKFWESVGLCKLDLSFNQISEIPEQIATLEDLSSLKMRSNCLSDIPRVLFEGCTLLRHLDLGQNALSVIDPAVANLEALVELILMENKIKSIPPHLEMCPQLQVLNLQSNQLVVLPELRLPFLREFNVGNNQLTSLPRSLSTYKRLEILVCSRNRIEILPDLRGLSCLTILDSMENRLREFPLGLECLCL